MVNESERIHDIREQHIIDAVFTSTTKDLSHFGQNTVNCIKVNREILFSLKNVILPYSVQFEYFYIDNGWSIAFMHKTAQIFFQTRLKKVLSFQGVKLVKSKIDFLIDTELIDTADLIAILNMYFPFFHM